MIGSLERRALFSSSGANARTPPAIRGGRSRSNSRSEADVTATHCLDYGYWLCAAEGNDVVLFEGDGVQELARFSFPRQNKDGGLCIADFFRGVDDETRDVIGL